MQFAFSRARCGKVPEVEEAMTLQNYVELWVSAGVGSMQPQDWS
jgi:hypothetical protein